MSEISAACNKVLNSIADALACGVLDLEEKKVVSLQHVPQFTPKQKEVTTRSMTALLTSVASKRLQGAVQAQFKLRKRASFKEIQLTVEQNFFFAKVVNEGEAAIFLVTRNTTNIGMAWVQIKSIISIVETDL